MDVPISTSTVLARRDQLFSANEQLALAGFLAGYSGLTRDAYTLDLRQYVAWCIEHRLAVFGARRADIECFARHLESLGRARTRIASLGTVRPAVVVAADLGPPRYRAAPDRCTHGAARPVHLPSWPIRV